MEESSLRPRRRRRYTTAKESVVRITTLTGVTLSEEQARRLMKRLGLRYRKSGSIPGKADPQLQLEFLRNEREPRLREVAERKRKVFFVDAAYFVLGCFFAMIWSFRRLLVQGASGRRRYSVLGAVDSHSKEIVTVRTTDSFNAATVCHLLEALRTKYPLTALLIALDNARYQHCAAVET